MNINMNKLLCSFKSNLPNEIDFAMKVATLLANSDNFSWSTNYPLVDAICSSLQVLTCVCKDAASTSACDCYPRFWHKILVGTQFDNPHLQAATLPPDVGRSCYQFNALKDHEAEDFAKIYRRVKATAELIKQFSMTAETECEEVIVTSKKLPKASESLLKFVSLLLFSHDKPLNLIGLDILSNIASKLSKVQEAPELVQMFQELCIANISCSDGDVYIMTRSIEAVSKMISSSSPGVYSGVVSLIVEKNILARLEQLLTSRSDVTLFLATTECFYRISRHQPHLIAARSSQHLLKTLINLLNFEDMQFFTPSALERIELTGTSDMCDLGSPEDFIKPSAMPTSRSVGTSLPASESKPARPPVTTPAPLASTKTNYPMVNLSNPMPIVSKSTTASAASITNGIPTKPISTPVQTTQAAQPTAQPVQPVSQAQTSHVPTKEYTCEWNGCKLKFPGTKQVYTHIFEVHVGALAQDQLTSCQWCGPNGTGPGCLTKRPKYSLLTHLNDFHCNATALERALTKSDPVKPPEHPGYGPNAALLAIRRHANLEKNGTKPANHSPLSVSVRLTAALILRNLASESNEMKQALGYHEPLLSEICMTNGRDESKIVAECLSLISNK